MAWGKLAEMKSRGPKFTVMDGRAFLARHEYRLSFIQHAGEPHFLALHDAGSPRPHEAAVDDARK